MAALSRENVARSFSDVARIIDATQASPTIVNESSNFVVVTYWWGRGRQNFNTARPCGDFHETILIKPVYLLNPKTAIPKYFRDAIVNNPEFQTFLKKKVNDHLGMINAHKRKGLPLSTIYTERSEREIYPEIVKIILRYIELVLPQIQEFQRLFVERADLEKTFQRRVNAKLTEPAQLESIRHRLHELKEEKDRVLAGIKGRMGPFKQEMDQTLRYADPVTYDEMIRNWERTCERAGCNYMAVEYPEFAAPGGYQLAINAKPRFIQKALQLCGSRGVLYIDGDMTVNRYPAIFDTPDVDFMARGWHIDPRSSWRHQESILVDPYTFETSGGTMFFGPSPEAARLLVKWIETSELYSQWGKADDRILSLIFNTQSLLLPLKIIQLPIEYLWLTLDYDDTVEEEYTDREAIFLEHPECLTSEDTATGQGASSSRTPKFYQGIEDTYPRSEYLHEAVLFRNEEETRAFGPYLTYLQDAVYKKDVEEESLRGEHPFVVVPFREGYGPFQRFVDANRAVIASLPELPFNADGSITITENNETTIPRILQALQAGLDVYYIPPTASDVYLESLATTLSRYPNIELAFVNKSPSTQRIFFYNAKFSQEEPAFFSAKSQHLQQFLSMCPTLSDFAALIPKSYQFLSRIRMNFLKKYRSVGGGVGGAEDANGMQSENAYNFLYGSNTSMVGGKRRRTQRRRRSVPKKRRTLYKKRRSYRR